MTTSQSKSKAVVVGTGAGGAVAGAVLAGAGIDTIIIEQGRYYKPSEHADILTSMKRMYLNAGFTVALGRPSIPFMLGQAVGGSTIVNSATCFRPPVEKVISWGGPAWDELVPFFEEVERRINAKPLDIGLLGGNWRVLKRGCDAMGVEIKPLVHNVRECKGSGLCAFGCPTGAKQSTDITFIPGAVKAGATLLTEHRVDDVILEDGRAVGVSGTCPGGRFEVRADAVVLAMGAISGPAFLLRKGLANSSGRVGYHLNIHPATRVTAEFDEIVDGHIGVPQGAYIDHWADRGIMLEGIFTPPGPMLASLPAVGFEFKDLAARYRNLCAFGVMVSDTSSGRVRAGWFGAPFLVKYRLNQADAENMRYGVARLAELYLAAGAKRVFVNFLPLPIIDGPDGVARLEAAPVKPRYFDMMAFHPLGTCAMGGDPMKSVVDFSLRSHDTPNLYIMDGSVIPHSLGVNPQITIMALAMRAAGILADRLRSS